MAGGSSDGSPPPGPKRRVKRREHIGLDGAVSKPAVPKQQSSPYIGVTKYKRTGRYEAHVWNSQSTAPSASGKKGRQLHLGSFSDGERAAKAYDMACIHLKGYDRANTNFPKEHYHHEPFMVENHHLPLDEFVLRLRKWAQLNPREEEHRLPARPAHRFMPQLAAEDHVHSFGFTARLPPQYSSQPATSYFDSRQLGQDAYGGSRLMAGGSGSDGGGGGASSGGYWHAGHSTRPQLPGELPREDTQLYNQLQHAKMLDQQNSRLPQRYGSLSEPASDPSGTWPPPGARRAADVDELSRAAASGHMMGAASARQPAAQPDAAQHHTKMELSRHSRPTQQVEVEGGHAAAYCAPPGWGPSHLLASSLGTPAAMGHGSQERLERARSESMHYHRVQLPPSLPDVPLQLRQGATSPGAASPLLQSTGFPASLYDAHMSHDMGLLRRRSQHATGSGGGGGGGHRHASLNALTAAQHHMASRAPLHDSLWGAPGSHRPPATDGAVDTSNEQSPSEGPSVYLSEPGGAFYE